MFIDQTNIFIALCERTFETVLKLYLFSLWKHHVNLLLQETYVLKKETYIVLLNLYCFIVSRYIVLFLYKKLMYLSSFALERLVDEIFQFEFFV